MWWSFLLCRVVWGLSRQCHNCHIKTKYLASAPALPLLSCRRWPGWRSEGTPLIVNRQKPHCPNRREARGFPACGPRGQHLDAGRSGSVPPSTWGQRPAADPRCPQRVTFHRLQWRLQHPGETTAPQQHRERRGTNSRQAAILGMHCSTAKLMTFREFGNVLLCGGQRDKEIQD